MRQSCRVIMLPYTRLYRYALSASIHVLGGNGSTRVQRAGAMWPGGRHGSICGCLHRCGCGTCAYRIRPICTSAYQRHTDHPAGDRDRWLRSLAYSPREQQRSTWLTSSSLSSRAFHCVTSPAIRACRTKAHQDNPVDLTTHDASTCNLQLTQPPLECPHLHLTMAHVPTTLAVHQ